MFIVECCCPLVVLTLSRATPATMAMMMAAMVPNQNDFIPSPIVPYLSGSQLGNELRTIVTKPLSDLKRDTFASRMTGL